MGAGILECDVTFTKDKELVCRHDQCDLHTTTNILATPLASKCTKPFIPVNSATGTPAQVLCCTSDLTLAEFKSLKGKMDAFNPKGNYRCRVYGRNRELAHGFVCDKGNAVEPQGKYSTRIHG